jgi:hypothetical protein
MNKPHYQQNSATNRKNPNQIQCLQIYFQHSRSATYNMMNVIEKEESDLLFVQEPYEYQNRPVGIEKKYRIFTAGIIINSRRKKLEEYQARNQLHIINKESERFTFHNNRGSSNIDLSIANNNLIAAMNEWEISAKESCSDHNFLKYTIRITNSFNNMYNYEYKGI